MTRLWQSASGFSSPHPLPSPPTISHTAVRSRHSTRHVPVAAHYLQNKTHPPMAYKAAESGATWVGRREERKPNQRQTCKSDVTWEHPGRVHYSKDRLVCKQKKIPKMTMGDFYHQPCLLLQTQVLLSPASPSTHAPWPTCYSSSHTKFTPASGPLQLPPSRSSQGHSHTSFCTLLTYGLHREAFLHYLTIVGKQPSVRSLFVCCSVLHWTLLASSPTRKKIT